MSRLYNKSYRSIFQADSTTVKSGSFRLKSSSRVIIKEAITEKKMVTHYGAIAEFKVDRFRKIYGKAAVEAHRFLKNHIHSHTYALVTHQYSQQANHSNMEQWEDKSQLCEVYDVGELCYTYFPYEMAAAS